MSINRIFKIANGNLPKIRRKQIPPLQRFPVMVCLSAVFVIVFALILGACSMDSSSRNSTAESMVYYVNGSVGVSGDGTSWDTAFSHPQEAIDAAAAGDQVWVSAGVYVPQGGCGTQVLRLKEGVTVLGGFSGSESDAEERDPASEVAVLDGEGRSRHVVLGADGAVLDGFTITGGNADGNQYESPNGGSFSGGGMFNSGVAPQVRNCRFIGNTAFYNGGAVFNDNSDPLIVDCVFTENTASFGGAMDNRMSSPTVVNAKFEANTSTVSGGAVSNFGGSPSFVNAVFTGNISGQVGGAVLSNSSEDVYTNCSIVGNQAGQSGGGIGTYRSSLNVLNTILWDNRSGTGGEVSNTEGAVKVLYSIVKGGYAGTGNLDQSPGFEQEGSWQVDGSWMDGDYHLNSQSPAVDNGNDTLAPLFDADYNSRPQFFASDIGAYEKVEK